MVKTRRWGTSRAKGYFYQEMLAKLLCILWVSLVVGTAVDSVFVIYSWVRVTPGCIYLCRDDDLEFKMNPTTGKPFGFDGPIDKTWLRALDPGATKRNARPRLAGTSCLTNDMKIRDN